MFVLAELLVLIIGGALMLAFYFCVLLWAIGTVICQGIAWCWRELRWRLGARKRARLYAQMHYPEPVRARPGMSRHGQAPRLGVRVNGRDEDAG
jgi:hypothetical protein